MRTTDTPPIELAIRSQSVNWYKLLVLLILLFLILPVSEVVDSGRTMDGTMSMPMESRRESTRQSTIALNPAAGKDISIVYEAFPSPNQESGEEEDTPIIIPPELRASAPSVPRNKRTSRGHAILEFTNDLSRAYVHFAVENVNAADVNMMHLHCGRPGELGPILVDFSLIGNLSDYLSDGLLNLEITNEDLVMAANQDHGFIQALIAGCPINSVIPADKIKTIAGMEYMARQGELYINLHTNGQTYFGEMRGQFHLVESVASVATPDGSNP